MDESKHEAIEKRAYYLWAADGYPPSDGVHYWLKAEAEYEDDCHKAAVDKFSKPFVKVIETITQSPTVQAVKNSEAGQAATGYLSSFFNRLCGGK